MIDHKGYAARLGAAYAGPTIAPIRHAEPRATMDDAYAIQTLNRDYWVQEGRRIVGAKIGLTSKAVQQQLGVDQPDFGILFANMQIGDPGGVSAGLFVLGTQPVDIGRIDLPACVMRMEKNGTLASEGRGAACLGGPLNALAWLAAMRIERGEPLRAGDIILSGTLGPMVPAMPGDAFQAEIAASPSASLPRPCPYPNVPLRGPMKPKRYAATLRICISSAPSVMR